MIKKLLPVILVLLLTSAQASEVRECDSCDSCTELAKKSNLEIRLNKSIEAVSETCLLVNGSNLLIDCQGHSVTAKEGMAFAIAGAKNVEIRNCSIVKSDYGIITSRFDSSLKVTESRIVNNYEGVRFIDFYEGELYRPSLEMRGNRLFDNQYGILLDTEGNPEILITENEFDNTYNIWFPDVLHEYYRLDVNDNYFSVDGCGALLQGFLCPKHGCPEIETIKVRDPAILDYKTVRCEDTEHLTPELTGAYFDDYSELGIYLGYPLEPSNIGDEVTLTFEDGSEPIPLQMPEKYIMIHVDNDLELRILKGAALHFNGSSYFVPASSDVEIVVGDVTRDYACEQIYGDKDPSEAIDVVVLRLDLKDLTDEAHIDPQRMQFFPTEKTFKEYVLDEIIDIQRDGFGILSTKPFDDEKELLNFWIYPGNPLDDAPMLRRYLQRYIQAIGAEKPKHRYPTVWQLCNGLRKQLYSTCPIDRLVLVVNRIDKEEFRDINVALGYCVTLAYPLEDMGKVSTHELGHALADLADEYTEEGLGSRPGVNCVSEPDTANLFWGDLHGQGKRQFRVGHHPGCSYVNRNIRPTLNSIMRETDEILKGDWYRGFGLFNERIISKVFNEFREELV